MCGFKIENDNLIKASPFNFHILPMSNDNLDSNRQYLNINTLYLLGSNNFDYNKLFYEGIEYVSL